MSEELKKLGGGGGSWMPKTTEKKTKNATHQRVNLPIPITILDRYKEVMLAGYIMFINGICFINTL